VLGPSVDAGAPLEELPILTKSTLMEQWDQIVTVSTTPPPNGLTYCIAVNIDEGGGGNFRYGTQDAASYSECRGGWPELG
jgi:hypothetical protein